MTQLINSDDFVHEQVHVAVNAIVFAAVTIIFLLITLIAYLFRKPAQGGKKKKE